MAKDPAVLFYTNDFLAGTFTMSNEQVGKYIRLLCLQHQKYVLTSKDMLNICQTYDFDIYSKFVQDGDNYYNERMRVETDRRRNYSESRKKNRNSSNNPKNDNTYDNTYVEHMETETETETINVIKIGSKEVFQKNTAPTHLLAKYISDNYPSISKMQSQLTNDQCDKLLQKHSKELILEILDAMENKKDLVKKYKSVYLTINNWIKVRGNNGSNKTTSPRGSIDFNKWERELKIARGEMPDLASGTI